MNKLQKIIAWPLVIIFAPIVFLWVCLEIFLEWLWAALFPASWKRARERVEWYQEVYEHEQSMRVEMLREIGKWLKG